MHRVEEDEECAKKAAGKLVSAATRTTHAAKQPMAGCISTIYRGRRWSGVSAGWFFNLCKVLLCGQNRPWLGDAGPLKAATPQINCHGGGVAAVRPCQSKLALA